MSAKPTKASELPKTKNTAASGIIFLFLLTFVVYLPAWNGGFLWDDDVLITENPLVHQSDGLKYIWFSTQPHDYFPLTLTMLWFEWRLWGMETTGYHLINILLHAGGAILLWRTLLRLKIPGAFVAATLFAVHPVGVASVAWIAERKNTLSLVFFLLSALCFFRFEDESAESNVEVGSVPEKGSVTKWYLLSLGAFLLALLAKTSVVMLPIVLLGCAWWRRGKIAKQDIVRTAPFFLLSLALGLVTVWFQTHRAIGGKVDEPLVRIAGGGWAAWFYLFKAILPTKLSMIYSRWAINPSSATAWLPWIGWVVTFGILFKFRRTWGRPLLFALGYFFITLLPVLGFFDMSFFTYARAADHLQYLSLIGIVALIGAFPAGNPKGKPAGRPHHSWFVPAASILIIAGSALSWQRAQVFFSSERLWMDTLNKNPKAWVAYNNLGEAIVSPETVNDAIRFFQNAVHLNPNYAEAWNNLGNALGNADRVDEAFDAFKSALRARPDYAIAENNWGLVLARRERIDEALPHFEKALQLSPDYPDAHYNLALTLTQQGKTADAIQHYEAALKVRPDYVQPRLNLASLFSDMGEDEKAIQQLNEALKQDPQSSEAHNGLGLILVKKKDFAQAEKHFSEAVRLDPANLTAANNLTLALTKQNKHAEAIPVLESLLQRMPDNPEIHSKLGIALYEAKRYEAALPHLEIAREANPRNPVAHYQIGLVLAKLERRAEAMKAFREALNLRPNYMEAREQLDALR